MQGLGRVSLALIWSLIVATLSGVAPAFSATGSYAGGDASGPVVVVFSNETYTDEDEEDTDIRIALVSISKTVTVFDGGDGSSDAWQTALSGADVLIWPERSGLEAWASGGNAVLSAGAQSWIKSWVEGGKLVVGTGSYSHLQMITDLTGVNFNGTGNSSLDSTGDPWARVSSNTSLPASVPAANYTGGISNYSSLSDAQKAVLERVYYDAAKDNVAVANFTVGSGFYVYNAYDWYPSASDVSSGRRAEWDATLQFAATGAVTGQTFNAAPEEPSAPRSPRFARFDAYSVGLSDSGSPRLAIEGVRLWCINSLTVDEIEVPFETGFSTPWYEYIHADITGIQPGPKTLIAQTCMGEVTYENWFTITALVDPKSTWMKAQSFGLNESMRSKIAAFNSSLGDGYYKIRCIVNSSNGEDMNEAFAKQICSFAQSNDLWQAEVVHETKATFTGRGYWVNIWASGGYN